MKKNINNKVYDTETAKRCYAWNNDLQPTDSKYIEESLYRKKNGEFFLHGRGGAMTKYCSWDGKTAAEGERIIPLTFDEAQLWAEMHLTQKEYDALFGEPEEDGKTEVIPLRLSSAAVLKLRIEASRTGKTISDLLSDLILKNL